MYKRILLPIDGSELSYLAAEAGVALAQSEGASVVGFVVLPEYGIPAFFPNELAANYPSKDLYEREAQSEGQGYLQRVRVAAKSLNVAMESDVTFAKSVAPEIISAAKRFRCDLIVMGSHGRAGLSRVFLGSVTNKVLAGCHVPVLVHRPPSED